ncbi:MAG: pyruvate, phosphate dikinase [Rhodospirillales bacterium]|nr:MAG: pyruvate, phosphate dikinase [Rhodospirillales bacterium]
MTKWVYYFGEDGADGGAKLKNLLGGKGANLAEMCNLGVPVPAGFTISTEVCTYFYDHGRTYPPDLKAQVEESLARVEKKMGGKFGATEGPLVLMSVRSGARASMPGMMDTVLNLGLNDDTVRNLAEQTGDERFAFDSYRRFIQMFSNVVLGIDSHHFEELLQRHKDEQGKVLDVEMTASDWKVLVQAYKNEVKKHLDTPFPLDPMEQLWGAIGAVFGSWMNKRAITYRKLHSLPDHWGTAVNVQAMVFGNMGDDCATGVCFTRNPSTGENAFYGEYLVNAQGEDVVAGIRTPQPLSLAEKATMESDLPAMEELLPQLYTELVAVRDKLERHYTDMQDMEFTIQRNKLWMLQTRTGKRTAQAALRMAVEMCEEDLIDKREAVRRMDPAALDQLLHPMIDPNAVKEVLGKGLPASPGAASGQIVFNAEDAETWVKAGRKVILTRIETSPEDIGGMYAAEGILTTRGGMTSHAAVVARGMGKPCVAGAGDLRVNYGTKTLTAGNVVLNEGDWITLDGTTGQVLKGEVPKIQPQLTGNFGILMGWADEIRTLKVRANAETPLDAGTARNFGCEGIGLCRTEHMFFDPQRIIHVRQMIVAETEAERRAALDKLLPYQRQDFVELFTIMAGLPLTIRLLDPPLHEFLPHTDADMAEVAKAAGKDVATVKAKAAVLHEANPMLGHRGCRLGVTYPEIYEMQCRAIFEAASDVLMTGEKIYPEVMLPLIATKAEFDRLKALVDRVAKEVMERTGAKIEYMVGTMIELPRAALIADKIAEGAEFFSFGTNDLTQTTYGLSRDDAGNFLVQYQDLGVLENDPFVTIDQEGVGELVRIAAERGRKTRPDLKLGICGEHGGDPASVHFCNSVGLNYVSCSPYRVPIARLAAAQAAMGERTDATA